MYRPTVRKLFKKITENAAIGISANIVSLGSLPDINVPYGTLFATLTLPVSVNALLTNGQTVPLSVLWSAGSYDHTTPATYALSGSVVLTPGVTNTGNLTASVNAIVANKLNITSVQAQEDIEVATGVEFGDLQLPDTVVVTLSNGTNRTIGVTWDEGDYDETVEGTYTLIGTLTVPSDLTNTGALTAAIDVIVDEVDQNYINTITLKLGGVTISIDNDEPIKARVGQSMTYEVDANGATAELQFKDSDTQTLELTRSGFTGSFTFNTPYKKYDILITATGLNSLPKHYRRAIEVWPVFAPESEANYVFDFDSIMDSRGSAFSGSATVAAVNGSTNLATSVPHGCVATNWIRLRKVVYQCKTGTTGSTLVLDRAYEGITETIPNNQTKNFGAANYNHTFDFNSIDTASYPLQNLLNKNGVDTGLDVRVRPNYKIYVKGTLLGHWQTTNICGHLSDTNSPVHWLFDNVRDNCNKLITAIFMAAKQSEHKPFN